MDYPVESGPPNYRRLFRRSAVWFAALGAAIAFLNQLLLGNGMQVSVLTGAGIPGWLARWRAFVEHWDTTLVSMVFGGVLGLIGGLIFASVRAIRLWANRLSQSPSQTPALPASRTQSEQITTHPGVPEAATGPERSAQITSEPRASPVDVTLGAGGRVNRDVVFTYSRSQLMFCVLTAVIVGLTAYVCAWLSYGDYYYFTYKQSSTRQALRVLSVEIEQYRQKTGRLPAELTELDKKKIAPFVVGQGGPPRDFWSRPLHYDVNGDSYDLYSLGRDGQPGGSGVDADLHADRVDWWTEGLTFWQFATASGTDGIKFVCILAGIVAFPLCLLGVRKSALERAPATKVLLRYAVTAIFAVFMAVVISFLHLPSGH
jgi:hypothetical protein